MSDSFRSIRLEGEPELTETEVTASLVPLFKVAGAYCDQFNVDVVTRERMMRAFTEGACFGAGNVLMQQMKRTLAKSTSKTIQ